LLNAKLKPIESDEERGAKRYRLLLQASAEAPEIGLTDVVIHDLSATGFLIECGERLATGTEINLELPGPSFVAGEVLWSSGNFFGGEFSAPLDGAALASARSTSPVIWPDFVAKSAANRIGVIGEVPDEHGKRLPFGGRLLVITGASLLLWLPIGLGVWSAVS